MRNRTYASCGIIGKESFVEKNCLQIMKELTQSLLKVNSDLMDLSIALWNESDDIFIDNSPAELSIDELLIYESDIEKCHKIYIILCNRFEEMTGVGLSLNYKLCDEEIPGVDTDYYWTYTVELSDPLNKIGAQLSLWTTDD